MCDACECAYIRNDTSIVTSNLVGHFVRKPLPAWLALSEGHAVCVVGACSEGKNRERARYVGGWPGDSANAGSITLPDSILRLGTSQPIEEDRALSNTARIVNQSIAE
jgi:hypothetical protein